MLKKLYKSNKKIQLLLVLVLTLLSLNLEAKNCEKFDDFDEATSVKLDRNKWSDLVERSQVYSSNEIYKKMYPNCGSKTSCDKKYKLLRVELFKDKNNLYFYKLRILIGNKKGPARRCIFFKGADKPKAPIELENNSSAS